MSKVFYDHLIKIEEVVMEFDGQEIAIEEREELIGLIDQTIHHHTLVLILDHLPREHHETFLTRFHQTPHDPKLLLFLKENVSIDIEETIRTKAQQIKKEILQEIKKSRKK